MNSLELILIEMEQLNTNLSGEFEINVFDSIFLKAIENPANNSIIPRQSILESATEIARNAFNMPEMSEAEVEEHALQVDKLFLIKKDNLSIGFSTTKHFKLEESDEKITATYLSGTAIKKEFHGHGIYSITRPLTILAEGNSDYFFTRTQNVLVFSSLLDLGISPNLEGFDEELLQKAKTFAQLIDCDNKLDGFAIKQLYKDQRNSGIIHRNDKINKRFNELIDLANGDSLLMVGKFNKEKILQVVRRELIKVKGTI